MRTPDQKTMSATAWINSFYPDTQRQSRLQSARFARETTEGVMTQNVRGFVAASRSAWMGGWQQRIKGNRIRAVCVQETHVNSVSEAKELEAMWARMWNLQVDEENPISFWSVTENRAAGVGILLHPAEAGKYQARPWDGEQGRGLLITSGVDGLLNIYAPNSPKERELFFTDVQAAMRAAPERMIVVGDFNCVLHPPRDRVTNGSWATGDSESAQLDALVSYWRLVDAVRAVQRSTAVGPDPSELTYWHQGNGARLDRAYVTPTMRDWLVGAEARPPAASTDHHGVVIWLRDPLLQPLKSPIAPLAYPIRGRDQQAIAEEVELAISAVIRSACHLKLDWDVTSAHLRDALRQIQMRERRRARRAEKKWRRRMRKHIRTLDDRIEYERKCTERRLMRRRGARLGDVAGRSLLQRLADRPRHAITDLTTVSTDSNLSQADVMAAAWEPLLSQSHATAAGEPPVGKLYEIPDTVLGFLNRTTFCS